MQKFKQETGFGMELLEEDNKHCTVWKYCQSLPQGGGWASHWKSELSYERAWQLRTILS